MNGRDHQRASEELQRRRALDRERLRYAGFLGHRFALLIDDVSDGRRVYVECGDLAYAYRQSQAEKNPKIYEQVGRGKWRPVGWGRAAAAALAADKEAR